MPASPLETIAGRAFSRRNFLAASALGVASAALLTACSSDGAALVSSKSGSKTLTYLDPEIPTSAQVQESGTWQTRDLLQNLTDRLINRNPTTFELEPWIAESWTQSSDGLDYVFVIKDGVSYSDGTPLDVNSVKKNLEWQVNGDPKNGVSANSQFPRKIAVSVDAGKREVHVHFDTAYAPFLNILTSWSAGLVANATIDAPHDQQVEYTKLIGSGPFHVTSEKYAQKYVLERREDYAWAPKSAKNQGQAKLQKVIWIPTQDDSVRLGAVQSGQAGILRYVQPREEAVLAKQNYKVIAKTGVGLSNQWYLRTAVAPLDDIDVRRALFRAIDRKQILDELYTKNWSAATSVLAPNTFGYKDVSASFAYDPDQAESLLSSAGWTGKDSAGYRTKGGTRLHLKTYIDVFDNTANALFQNIQAQFKAIGIELALNTVDYSDYGTKATGDKHVNFLRTGWPHPDAGVDLHQSYGKAGSDELQLKGSDVKLDQLLDAQLVAVDDEERKALLGQIQDYLVTEKAYVLPILNDSQVFVVRPEITGFELSDGALPLFSNVKVSA